MTRDVARILAVDDEEYIRELLLAGLSQASYECIDAARADRAAELLEQQEFDLALLDVNMPGRSGMELLSDIKVRHPDVAVLMLTGDVEVTKAVSAMQQGAYDYVTKPVSMPELVTRIEHALSRRALTLQNRTLLSRQEEIIDELNVLLEQRRRELGALNKLFQSYASQVDNTREAYASLQDAVRAFNEEAERLATVANLVRPNGVDSQRPQPTKHSEAGLR